MRELVDMMPLVTGTIDLARMRSLEAVGSMVDSAEQEAVCRRFGVDPVSPLDGERVGINPNVRTGLQPVNALRHPPEQGTCGWYIWAGEELSDDPDFFVALHVEHVPEWCPALVPFLALPPGYRVLLAPGHEDVWFDASLLSL